MGALVGLSKWEIAKYGLACFFLVILGIYLLFTNYWIYGIILIVLGIAGLITFKTAQFIYTRPAKNVERNLKKSKNIGLFVGAILGGLAGLIYASYKGVETANYSGNSFYILIPLIVGGVIGWLIEKLVKKSK